VGKAADNSAKFHSLRSRFTEFFYEQYWCQTKGDYLVAGFRFKLGDAITFHPTLQIPLAWCRPGWLDSPGLKTIVFNLGMIELISYWKAACSPRIIIGCGALSGEQVAWWKKLYYLGLGEFFYINGIITGPEEFAGIVAESDLRHLPGDDVLNEQYLVPVGGGKDSLVTLEAFLQEGLDVVPLVVNPTPASLRTLGIAGFRDDQVLRITRNLDPRLLQLNKEGFLNGHTPFSALLAFVASLAALATGRRHIALSNEASANEGNIAGSTVNHQYSKSFEFERDFRSYCSAHIHPGLDYYSFLRPLSELQIARIFSRHDKYLASFRSCNAGGKTGVWCGKCPKCLFTCIILSPFLTRETLTTVFGRDLLGEEALIPILRSLTGLDEVKPFECVGTRKEINAALAWVTDRQDPEKLPVLLKYYKNSPLYGRYSPSDLRPLLENFNGEHFLSPAQALLMKKLMT
jgi:hypothetical protein